MAHITINGTTYRTLATSGQSRGIVGQQRRRAINFNLLVDDVAGGSAAVSEKQEDTLDFIGTVSGSSTVLFTITTAKAFRALLLSGSVTVAGDVGSYTARARDVRERDVPVGAGIWRVVSATLEEV